MIVYHENLSRDISAVAESSDVLAGELLRSVAGGDPETYQQAHDVLQAAFSVVRTIYYRDANPSNGRAIPETVREVMTVLADQQNLKHFIKQARTFIPEADADLDCLTRYATLLSHPEGGKVSAIIAAAMLSHAVRPVRLPARQGSLTLAIVLFLAIITILFSTELFKGLAYYEASRALDERAEMRAERSALENAITEAVYGRFGTRSTRDSRTIFNSVEDKVDALSGGGTTFTVNAISGGITSMLPSEVNSQYPDPNTPVLTDLGSASANTVRSPVVNRHLTTSSFFGVPGGLGVGSGQMGVQITRSNGVAAEDRVWNFVAEIVTVPVSNWELVAYGLPASGSVPASAPTGLANVLTSTFYANGGRAITASANNPSGDTTVFPALYESGAGSERLPYYYRGDTAFAWDAYEVVSGFNFRDPFYDIAGKTHLEDPVGNPTAYFDFQVVDPADPPDAADMPNGMAYDPALDRVTIDVGAVTDPVLFVVDQGAIGSVEVVGSALASSTPFVLWIVNDNGALARTPVTFSGSNFRPFLCYTTSSEIAFTGGTWQGGFIFGPGSSVVAPSTVSIEGHLSFYSGANPFPSWNLTILPSETVASILAPIAPRVLIADAVATN